MLIVNTITEQRLLLPARSVQQVRESHRPIQITGKNGAAVLVSDADWNNIEATLALTAIPGMRESILEGMQPPRILTHPRPRG
ncbi:MAG: type II toxin-antitoxin system Phd/YefM family antitoxin [Spirochaetaceae bacterium]